MEMVARSRVDARAVPIQSRCRVERGRPPTAGISSRRFKWRNVLETPPPIRREVGAGAFVIYDGQDATDTERVVFTTIIAVDPGADEVSTADDVIVVESRISLLKRPMLELIDAERRFTDRVTARWRERLSRRLVQRRRRAADLKTGWRASALLALVRVDARVTDAAIRATRRTLRGAVAIPDALATRALDTRHHMEGRLGRRAIRRGMFDPESLNSQQKGAVVFILSVALVALVLVANTVVALGVPQFAETYRRLLFDAGLSLAGTLAVPFPVEAGLVASVLAMGPALGVTGLFVGKLAGAWLLYLIGDSLYDAVHVRTATRPRLGRAIAWLNASAAKYGFWLLIPVNAIPLLPDILLYVFALSGMPFRPYMAGIAVGTALKFGLIVWAMNALGPERITGFLAHPFG